MDITVKQRLLGGVILIAGAVLFLPVLLQGAGVKALQPPSAPAVPKTPTTAELAPPLQKDAAQIDQDIVSSHGEPTFYPVQPGKAPAPAISDETPEQFKLVTPAKAPVVAAVEAKPEEGKPADVKPVEAKGAEKAQADKLNADKLKAQQAHAEAEAKSKADKVAEARKAEEKKAADKKQEEKKAADKKVADAQAAAKAQEKPQDKPAAAHKPADPDPALPQAWVVQVAVLSSKDKAQALEAKLRAKGFRASVTGSGDKWRVVTGPELDKSVADSVRGRLEAAGFSGGWVQAYRP